MLDKKSFKILSQLNKMCNNTYKVFEKTELQNLFKVSNEALVNHLNFLSERQLIDVKYQDENVICLCVLPKALTEMEGKADEEGYYKKFTKIMYFTCLFSAISAFLGAFVAVLIIG